MRAMRVMQSAAMAILLTAAFASVAAAQGEKKLDLTGKWLFSVQSDAGTGTPTVTFTQKGDSLSGHYSSQTLGERDFTGTVKDGKVKFSFSAEAQGQQFSITYSGTLDGENAMKGTVDLGGMASGSFAAKRAPN